MSKFFISLLLVLFINSCATTALVINDFNLEEGDVKAGLIKLEKDSGKVETLPFFVFGREPKTTYDLFSNGKKVTVISVGNGCWSYGLGGVIIPIPFLPFFSLPKDYSINTRFIDKNLSPERVRFKLILDKHEYEGVKGKRGNITFPIRCNKFDKGRILITGLTSDEIILGISRNTSFLYGVGLFMNN